MAVCRGNPSAATDLEDRHYLRVEYPGELKVNLSKLIVIIIWVMIPKKVKWLATLLLGLRLYGFRGLRLRG